MSMTKRSEAPGKSGNVFTAPVHVGPAPASLTAWQDTTYSVNFAMPAEIVIVAVLIPGTTSLAAEHS
jgi:hypothetical protein